MATFTWIGGSGDFGVAANWQVGGSPAVTAPGTADDAVIAAPGAYTVAVASASVGSLTVTDTGANIVVGGTLAVSADGAGVLANAGTIKISAGATLTEGPGIFSDPLSGNLFANTGTLVISNGASVILNATATTAGLGTFVNASNAVTLDIALDNTGATFTPADFGNPGIVGAVAGGVVAAGTAGVTLGLSFIGFLRLDGVTFDGPVRLTSTGMITGGLTLHDAAGSGPGDLAIAAPITVSGTTTLDNATVRLDTFMGGLAITDQLTFAPGLTLAMADTGMGGIAGPGALLNQGSIGIHGKFDITAPLANDGVVAVGTSFVFLGMLSRPGQGVLDIHPGVPIRNDGTFLAGGGSVIFRTSVQGEGLIAVSANGTITGSVEMAGLYDQQLFAFLDDSASVLKFDAVSGTNALLGFRPGNTIELVGTPATVVFNDTTLSIISGGTAIAGFVLPDLPAGTQFSAVTDGNLNTFITELPCFAAGTRIRTATGDVAIEHLRVGDRVVSAFGGTVPIQWIGHRHVDAARHPDPASVWPVRIRAGALADAMPASDLLVSPEHAIHLEGVLVPARHLVNGTSIAQEPRAAITYFHVELPQHDVILAENAPCESYLDTGNRADFAGGAVTTAHPTFASANDIWLACACAPQCRGGPRLAAIRAGLAGRDEKAKGKASGGQGGQRPPGPGFLARG